MTENKNLMNTVKQKTNQKKYMITLQKVRKFAANVLGINTVKNLKNFSTAWKREMYCVELLKCCLTMEMKLLLHLKLT